jgi:hypothetical protein
VLRERIRHLTPNAPFESIEARRRLRAATTRKGGNDGE